MPSVHDGDIKFKCYLCNKIFQQEILWAQHMNRNHLCIICNLTFSQKFILNTHLERVHEIFDESKKFNVEINKYKKEVEEKLNNENYDEGMSKILCGVFNLLMF